MSKKIIIAIVIMLGIIIVCEIFANIFYELYVYREREKLERAAKRQQAKENEK